MGYQVSEYLGQNYEPMIEKIVEFNTIGVLSESQIITNIQLLEKIGNFKEALASIDCLQIHLI